MAKQERDVRVLCDGVEMSMSEALRLNGEPDMRIRTIPEGESRTVNGRRFTVLPVCERCDEAGSFCECACGTCGDKDGCDCAAVRALDDDAYVAEVRRGAA